MDGIVTQWESNPEYWLDIEKIVTVDYLSKNRPGIMEEFRPLMVDGDTIVYFKTAPESWAQFLWKRRIRDCEKWQAYKMGDTL